MSKERSSVMKCQRDRSRWRICMNAPWRTKMIAGFVVILLTLVLTSRSIKWQTNVNSVPRHRYTVLINTWKRNDLLKKSVDHYGSCPSTGAIRVVWSEREPPSESLRSKLLDSVGRRRRGGGSPVELRIDMNDEDDLNNRFKPLEGLSTTAVLSIDDDVLVPCSTLELAFSVWLSAQDAMVGFVPRMHWTGSKRKSREHQSEMYTYGGWWSIWWTGSYSMVLTKAAFLHHKYFEYYTYEMPAEIREFVKNRRNCEDIAMSFLVANVTEAPPIWVKGKLYEIGSTGISSLKGHNYQRTLCLNYLTTLYGHMPLVSTNVKAVDAQMEWFW